MVWLEFKIFIGVFILSFWIMLFVFIWILFMLNCIGLICFNILVFVGWVYGFSVFLFFLIFLKGLFLELLKFWLKVLLCCFLKVLSCLSCLLRKVWVFLFFILSLVEWVLCFVSWRVFIVGFCIDSLYSLIVEFWGLLLFFFFWLWIVLLFLLLGLLFDVLLFDWGCGNGWLRLVV